MAFSEEELALAKQAADMADRVLPSLTWELQELQRRINWHAENRDRYQAMTQAHRAPAHTPSEPQTDVVDAIDERTPPRRGDAEGIIREVYAMMPGASGPEIRSAVEKRYGIKYGASTIYRYLEAFRNREVHDQVSR